MPEYMGKKLDSDTAQKLLDERAEGATASALSKKYGIAKSTIRGLFNRTPLESDTPRLNVVEVEQDTRDTQEEDELSAAADDDLLEALNGPVSPPPEESPEDEDEGYELPPQAPERAGFDMDALKQMLNETEAETTVQVAEKQPTTAAVANAIEDEADVRAKYLNRIYLNVINFKDHLPFIKNSDQFLASLHKKSTKELISLSSMIETQRSLGNVANQMKHLYFMGCRGLEYGSQRFLKLKTAGFTQEMLKQEKELQMIFHEIAIEKAEELKKYTSPQVRLLLLTSSTMLMMDSRNRMEEAAKKMEEKLDNKPPTDELNNKYADL